MHAMDRSYMFRIVSDTLGPLALASIADLLVFWPAISPIGIPQQGFPLLTGMVWEPVKTIDSNG